MKKRFSIADLSVVTELNKFFFFSMNYQVFVDNWLKILMKLRKWNSVQFSFHVQVAVCDLLQNTLGKHYSHGFYLLDFNRWTLLSNMLKHRSAAGVAFLDGEIYACGGHDGLSIFDSVRSYMTCFILLHASNHCGNHDDL